VGRQVRYDVGREEDRQSLAHEVHGRDDVGVLGLRPRGGPRVEDVETLVGANEPEQVISLHLGHRGGTVGGVSRVGKGSGWRCPVSAAREVYRCRRA
jgi:hypothetical protein